MRQIGSRSLPRITRTPSADALRRAITHQETGPSLATLATTGHIRGVYRFATFDAMNRHDDEALTRAIAANARAREAAQAK